jgi:hypothetical protein
LTSAELPSLQLPRYSVSALNAAVASLLERGFAPRFLLEATVSRPQLKKGHLWMNLVDEQASVSAAVQGMPAAEVAALACNLGLIDARINLVGLADAGLPYV